MIPLTVLHEAEAELRAAVEYYESQQPGLGLDLLQEIEAGIETIREAPARWRLHRDGTRRYLTARFPYLMVYLYEREHLWILAFAHCRRHPHYWSERMQGAKQEKEADLAE